MIQDIYISYILYHCCLIYILNLNDVDVRIIFHSMLFYSCRTHGLQLKKSINESMKENFHPWVKVDQANRPLPPKTLCILEGLALKTGISVQ